MGVFTQAGVLQFTPAWSEGNFKWTRATGHSLNFTNGTAADQADAFAEQTISLASDAAADVNLCQVPFTPFDSSANGFIQFQKIKFLSIINESTTSDVTIEPAAEDGWAVLPGVVPVHKGGVFLMTAPAVGHVVSPSSSLVTVTNLADVYTLTGNTTTGSANVTGISSTTNIKVGMLVAGTGIPADTTVASITSSTAVVLTKNATATGTAVSLTWRHPPAVIRYHVVGIRY